MMWPYLLGISGETHDAFTRLIERLEGDGYAKGEDTRRGQEIMVWAYGAALGSNAIERAQNEMFPHLSIELIREWELAMRLPNDASRTISERQTRLLLQERLHGAALPDLLALVETVGAIDGIHTTSAETVASEGADPRCAANLVVDLATATYDDVEARRQIVDVLRRTVPAKSYGHHTMPSPETLVTRATSAKWADATQKPDEVVLRNETQNPVVAAPFEQSRIASYGPLSKLRRSDLQKINDALFLFQEDGAGGIDFPGRGGARFYFGMSVAGSTTVTVDSTIDWRDRYVFGVTAISASEIRPGQAGDDDIHKSAGATQQTHWFLTGSGGATYDQGFDGTNISFRVNSGTGALEFVNAEVSTRYLVGMLIVTEQHEEYGGTAEDEGLDFEGFTNVEDMGDVTASWADKLFDAALWKKASGSSSGAGDATDGFARFFVMADHLKNNDYVLDDSMDWSDRLLIVVMFVRDSTGDNYTVFPGAENDDEFTSDGGSGVAQIFLAYTGDGTSGYDIPFFALSSFVGDMELRPVLINVDGRPRGLQLIHDTGSVVARATTACLVLATPQLGERNAVAVEDYVPTPVDTATIAPLELNAPQDIGVFTSPYPKDNVQLLPLGGIAKGDPAICYDARIEGAPVDGRPNTQSRVYHINTAGGAMRYVTEVCANAAHTRLSGGTRWRGIRTNDYRDSIVHLSGVYESAGAAAYPGGAADTTHNALPRYDAFFYTGPGQATTTTPKWSAEIATNLILYCDDEGDLYIYNNTGANVTVTGMLIATPVLGPRFPAGG